MNPQDGLFSAAAERAEQAKLNTEAVMPPVAPVTAGLFSAAAERELGGLPEAKQAEVAAPVGRREADRRLAQFRRPWPVTIIALYKFMNAVVVLVPLALLYFLPNLPWRSNELFKLMFYRTQGELMPQMAIPAIFAGYSAVVGLGLWTKRKWARNTVMGGAFVALMYAGRYAIVLAFLYGKFLFPGAEVLYLGLLFELLIFLVMKTYPDVKQVFHAGDYED